MPFTPRLLALLFLSPTLLAIEPDWVKRSNALAEPVLGSIGQFAPELASTIGQEALDIQILDLHPHRYERQQAATRAAIEYMKDARQHETDPHVQQDIDIVISHLEQSETSARLNHDTMLNYIHVSETVFLGLQSLLDPRNKPERQTQALIRLKRYAGLEKGYAPIVDLAQAYETAELTRPGLIGPYVGEVQQVMDNTDIYLQGIKALFIQDKIKGWEGPYAKLANQLRVFDRWQKLNVLPRARQDARLPSAIYQSALKDKGVDISPDELIERSTADYLETKDQIQILAKQIAASKNLPSSDYRDVIRYFKKDAVASDKVLSIYKKRLSDIEDIIRREHLITLPIRQANIRLATEAEAADVPVPQMNPGRLIGNTGEYGEFIIPISNPHAKTDAKFDDFTNEPVSWTLTAHEARPGHELQFASQIEHGISVPRVVFAINDANIEGWAVYCEALLLPYMPPEGQLFSLQERLQREARAFLDPMVNLGRLSPDDAKQFLMDEIALSEPMAQQEVDRYAFTSPGQATAYYYGYVSLRSLRAQTELALGKRFNMQAFNDFVVDQGVLPPPLLKQAVLNDFIPAQLAAHTKVQ